MANAWAFGATEEIRIADARGTLRKLGAYLRPHRAQLVAAGLMILVVSAVSMIPPWLAKHVIDDVIPRPHNAGTTLVQIGFAMMALHLVRAVLTYANRLIIAVTGQRTV